MCIYIYVDCDWQHWQRISTSQSTTALSDCFSLPGHKSDHGASRGSTPRQQELSKLKATAGCKVLLWIFGDPWSKAVSAASHKAYG